MRTDVRSPLDGLDGSERIAARDGLLRSGRSLLDGRLLRFRLPEPIGSGCPIRWAALPEPVPAPAVAAPLDRLQPRSIRPLPIRLKLRLRPAPAPAPVDPRYRLRLLDPDPISRDDCLRAMYEPLDRDAAPLLDRSGGRAETLRDGSPADYRCYRLHPDGSRTLLTRSGSTARRQPTGSTAADPLDAIIGSLSLPLPTQADYD